MQFLPKLSELESRYDESTARLSSADVLADPVRYQKAAKSHSELHDVVEKFRQWKRVQNSLQSTKALLEESDPEMKMLANEEFEELKKQQEQIERDLKVLLLPKDPNDEKNGVGEIRAGTGGDEATLFAQEIFRMYSRYAETRRWNVEVTSVSESAVGGLKEVIALVSGDKVYSQLKYESGVHRVQRVPETEQQGRVHTSAVTVA